MSHSNKRYVVYKSTTYPPYLSSLSRRYWIFSERSLYWERRSYDRTELVNELARMYRRQTVINFTSDVNSITYQDTYYDIPKKVSSRPGIKEWDCVNVTWFCIKIIRDDSENDIHIESLLKEVEAKLQKSVCKHSRYWSRKGKYCTPWKDQCKCKHQYEIHLNKHMDTCKETKIVI